MGRGVGVKLKIGKRKAEMKRDGKKRGGRGR
jgi:hypothetical protein